MTRLFAPLCALVFLSCVTTSPTSPPPEPPPPSEPPPSEPPSSEPPAAAARVPAIPPDHPQFARVEGTSFANDCQSDDQCFTGGCSNEMCSAEQGVTSTCEMPADGWPTTGASCGCVAGQCQWYNGPGNGQGDSASLPGVGQPCPDGSCAAGLTCMSYYGIAGPRGPTFTSCETPCGKGDTCPDGQSCVTIADGPGRVCRPSE